MRRSRKQQSWHLKRLYGHFNRKWFASSLPADTAVLFSYCNGDMAQTEYIPVDGIPAVISIAPILKKIGWDVVAMTLLHEMVHLDVMRRFGTKDNHGRRFNARMLELANAGAFNRYW